MVAHKREGDRDTTRRRQSHTVTTTTTTTMAAMETNNNSKDELRDQSKASKKGRSCKGTLYYSSALKSKAYNPLCVGVPRAIPEVPQSIVSETETKASKDDRHLTEFRYACAGYSLYLDRITKDHSGKEQPELPVCYGLELLVGKRMVQKTPAAAPVSAHVHHKQDVHEVPQTQRQQPTQSAGSSSTGLQETQILLLQG